jgi:D-lactate dehydrogenase
VEKFNANGKRIEVEYFPVKLGPATTRLAEGADVVCVFVNDNANAEVLTALAAGGTKMMALRCAGFNQTDVKALNALNMYGARVPAVCPFFTNES